VTGYGQFCSIARAHEVLGGRWTLLIAREILCGSVRFNDIRRGIPRISRTMLSERLHELVLVGAVTKIDGPHGPEYELTDAGKELANIVGALGTWGQRWLPRSARDEDNDLEPLLVDMQRRVRFELLPRDPIVVRFEVDQATRRFMLLKPTEASVCVTNPGFPELGIRSPLSALVSWWRGDCSFFETRRMGLRISGPADLVREFPDWFERYQLSGIPSEMKIAGRRRLSA
jgi:DNA-binding HxlR family transcriptional regulator